MSSPVASPEDSKPPPVAVRRFTVDEYRKLGEAGILTEHERVELLEGWIVPKMVHNPPHDNAVELADEALRLRLPVGWRIRIQSVLSTADSEPEPDLAVVRGSPRNRRSRHPTPAETGLVIEVADSSLQIDRGTKAVIYARAGIPVYWIVNLIDRQIEVHTEPSGPIERPLYRKIECLLAGQSVPFVIDDAIVATIPVDDLLP